MTEREESDLLERRLSKEEESRIVTHEFDNTWQFKSVPEEKLDKWKMEKEKYDEVIEYIREVEEILNLMRPFPRETNVEKQPEPPPRSDSQANSASLGLDHLENIIKLVDQLKEIQENIYKSNERTYYLKDLRKLREHKRKLKTEELLIRSRVRVESITSPEDYEMCSTNRKSSSTSEKLEHEPKDRWQDKRKSICLGENRSKVSKWTKVKEAFHWEKTSHSPRTCKKETCPGERSPRGAEEEVYSADHSPSDELVLDLFSSPPSPPTPPPPLPRLPRPENLLSTRPAHDLPSSSSSDRLDDFLTFSEVVKENKMDPDSPGHPFGMDDIEEPETVTRKSSCEEFSQHLGKEEFAASRSMKSNKTAWGKVKDIIQTRKDSLKKKPKKRGSDEFKKRRKLSTVSYPQFSDQFEDLSSEEKTKNAEIIPRTSYDSFEENLPTTPEDKCPKRLTPSLTVTLPSTEELRSLSSDDADKRDMSADGNIDCVTHFSCQAQYSEDKWKFAKNKLGSNQRFSRWIKVKRVFLTSGTPAQPPQYLTVSPSPTSQSKSCGFFSDMESDDLSSGEWIDEKSTYQEKSKLDYPEHNSSAMTIIQEDIQKSYNKLQKKLSQEFDQKLKEWEVKNEAPVKLEDSFPKTKGDEKDCIPKFRKARDSIAVPLPNLNDLSPEFKKKLSDWKKMKTSQSSSSVSSSATKEDIQGQNIKIRIGEWQPWRSRCSGKGANKNDQSAEDCSRKLEEAQKGYGAASQKKEEEGRIVRSVSRGGLKRRDSVKKMTHRRISSGGESLLSTVSTEKDGRFIRKSQKVKNFHWVEKELQKIEREKLRLEQEKEKYLEREARLEKMKKTMGTSPTQEILVRTPEGFVRFKGISQKFTKKLYEWEKARNIAPEASTFALLEESAQTGVNGDTEGDGITMQRSKSTGSVPELTSALLIQTMAHHPSSLSLNDVDELKTMKEVEEGTSLGQSKDDNEEPEAVIVDIEDIVEESGVLEDPSFQEETPVYTYASEEAEELKDFNGRLYVISGLDIKIIEEGSTGRRKNNAETLAILPDTDKCSRDAIVSPENSESRLSNIFLETTENEQMISQKNAIKYVQDTEKKEKIFKDPFQKFGVPNSEHHNSKTKDKKSEKNEILKGAGSEIHMPELGKSSQKAFTHSMNGNRKSLFLDKAEPHQPSFVKKSPEGFEQKEPYPEELRKKIKEKITLMQKMSMEANWRRNDFDITKLGRNTRDQEDVKGREELQGDFSEEQQIGNVAEELENVGSISVFVPTTRKIISPVKTTEEGTPLVCSYVIDDVKPDTREKLKQNESNQMLPFKKPPTNTEEETRLQDSISALPNLQKKADLKRDLGMPPLPNSPKMPKKLSTKETAPSIRMIIAKYNQKISEHDSAEGKRNEPGLPIWRSPVFGRRTQEKIDRYCGKDKENGRKHGEVQKSASLGNVKAGTTNGSPAPPQDHKAQTKGILKSSSAGIMRDSPQNHETSFISSLQDDKSDFGNFKETSPSVLRALKIQKAKEDFLSGRLGGASDASATSINWESSSILASNNLTIEPSEKSQQNMAKSVSAETISVEDNSSEIRAEKMADVRPLQKSSSKFDISSIKSRFRKIRMRKEKDPKLNAVAVLCRQSLFIEVPKTSENSSMSKSCPSSPVMDRNKPEKSSQP